MYLSSSTQVASDGAQKEEKEADGSSDGSSDGGPDSAADRAGWHHLPELLHDMLSLEHVGSHGVVVTIDMEEGKLTPKSMHHYQLSI